MRQCRTKALVSGRVRLQAIARLSLGRGAAPPPDVIAHSFGTWIVAHALQADPTLILGNVILVGSIIRPDWPWDQFIGRNQVTAVLNYCGDRDIWVRLAESFIPDSGPSGVIGFALPHDHVINILRPGGDHSSTFADDQLPATFEDVWRPFLSARSGDIDTRDHVILNTPRWVRAPHFLRAPVTLMLLLVSMALLVAAALRAS
jgi:pimeloyl-ACP methyl ester carboxylesterase